MKKYNRIWMIIMSMLLLFCQPLTVSATEPSAEQESETEEDEGDLQDEEESGSPEADGHAGIIASWKGMNMLGIAALCCAVVFVCEAVMPYLA